MHIYIYNKTKHTKHTKHTCQNIHFINLTFASCIEYSCIATYTYVRILSTCLFILLTRLRSQKTRQKKRLTREGIFTPCFLPYSWEGKKIEGGEFVGVTMLRSGKQYSQVHEGLTVYPGSSFALFKATTGTAATFIYD